MISGRCGMTTITRFLGVLGFLLCSGFAFSADDTAPAPAHQVTQHFRSKKNKGHTTGYLLFLPKSYTVKSKPWPLLMFLHGSGERGNSLALVKMHGPPKIVETKPDFPFVVVSPQCAKGKRFEPPLLLELLDELQTRLNIDPNRTYLTGLSMGGSGTWATADAAPKRFAAIVPICGTAPIDQKRFLRLPTWVTVGGKDKASLVQQLQETVAKLRDKGAPIRFTLYPQLGHNCWDATYGDPKIYTWLLKHSSDKRGGG